MIVLKNANIINLYPPQVEKNLDVVIKGNKIASKGNHSPQESKDKQKSKDIKVIDCSGKYVSPGLVCSHNHFYSMLARGIMAGIKPSKDFIGILKNLWWRLDTALDEESLYYSAITGALEAIKCGTTAVIDHNASPSFIRGSLSTLKTCFLKAGLRGILCYEVTDRNGKPGALEGVEESVDLIKSIDCGNLKSKEDSLVEGAIGAHALFTLSDDSLKLISHAVSETKRGIHIHAAEDQFDSSYSHRYHEMDIVERLESFGLLNEKAILAHGVHLKENEIELMNKYSSFLVHNPRSNMNNSVGYSDKLSLIDNLTLGTDGIGSDMLEELKMGFFKSSDARSPLILTRLIQALQNGNMILERYFGQNFGRVEEGFTADLVIFDYNSPTPVVSENLPGHLAFGLSSKNVETVIINGRIVMESGEFPFDTHPIYEKSRKQASRLWEKIKAG
ncbi:MAG: putative aminohydrolase SsnA [Acidobacteriota bacterium]